jgi:hypothetical protein
LTHCGDCGPREVVPDPVAGAVDAIETDQAACRVSTSPSIEAFQVYASAPSRGLSWKAILVPLVLGVGTAAYFVFPEVRLQLADAVQRGPAQMREVVSRLLPGRASAAPLVPLFFESDPAGARVFVEGSELGTTPLEVENDYPETAIEVRLEMPGYRRWTGWFPGARGWRVRAELSR